MLRQEKRTPFNDQDPCVRVDRQRPLGKGVGAKTAADDDVVELFFFADCFPFPLGEEENMIHDLLGRGILWSGRGKTVIEILGRRNCTHNDALHQLADSTAP
ncbi:hypothetical protein [Arthrobacter sp. MMS24-S77]